MLEWPEFVHAHAEPIATIVKAHDCDFGFVMECANLEAEDRLAIGCGPLREDDYRVVIIVISVIIIDSSLYLLNSGRP